MATENKKFAKSIEELKHALKFKPKIKSDRFFFCGIAKSFEVCLEYAWKCFNQRAIEEGLDVYSPKDSIKMAGRLGMVDDVEKWLKFLNDRNIAVHDYVGIPDDVYLEIIEKFYEEVRKLKLE